jgi:hypothetical protein
VVDQFNLVYNVAADIFKVSKSWLLFYNKDGCEYSFQVRSDHKSPDNAGLSAIIL